jgi:hypothetical protein
VLVLSFSRSAGNDARFWNEHLSKGFPTQVWLTGSLCSNPPAKLFRSFAVSGMKSSMPLPVQAKLSCCITMKNCGNSVLEFSDYSQAKHSKFPQKSCEPHDSLCRMSGIASSRSVLYSR